MIEQMSLKAYYKFSENGYFSRQEKIIIGVLDSFPYPLTYQQIAERGKLRLSSVCGRMNDLKKKGIVEKHGHVINPYTGTKNNTWRLIKYGRWKRNIPK